MGYANEFADFFASSRYEPSSQVVTVCWVSPQRVLVLAWVHEVCVSFIFLQHVATRILQDLLFTVRVRDHDDSKMASGCPEILPNGRLQPVASHLKGIVEQSIGSSNHSVHS